MKHLFRLSRREYFADFFITPPLTALAAVASVRAGLPDFWPAAFLAGLFAWTFYEYALHRWVLHGWLWRSVHRLHHGMPRDYIALHPAATLALYGLGWSIFGFRSSPAMLGFLTGYIAYAVLHTAFHYDGLIAEAVPWLALRHDTHHAVPRFNYGVSTSLWDRVFRTEFSARSARKSYPAPNRQT